eukprot:TRINITY_DN898_c0_g1_i2.p1 TRINITY_DN898_c0_g1~~TRINITY_DN898_c0_g1_i2.p1  ORF type:complete len:104 (+),score=21.09 TRINITY_DN898_c0_g1_i2:94-405(+)
MKDSILETMFLKIQNLLKGLWKKPTIPNITADILKTLETSVSNFEQNQSLLTLVPRKPTWDLKRDLSSKLEKLDRKTQKAIYEMLIEKAEKQKEIEDVEKKKE